MIHYTDSRTIDLVFLKPYLADKPVGIFFFEWRKQEHECFAYSERNKVPEQDVVPESDRTGRRGRSL